MQLLAKNMAGTHVHAFAYAIKQTPYAFVAKIILCMYLLYDKGKIVNRKKGYGGNNETAGRTV